MSTPLAGFGVDIPVIAAPMAGGASTPALVVAAARAGGLGFLAAGYKTPQALAGQISEVRSAGLPFAVNVFAPNPVPADPAAYRRYARAIRPEAEHDAVAPAGYPAIHHLTSPMRRAAAAAGDVERLHLWAGAAYRHATAEAAGRILARLASGL